MRDGLLSLVALNPSRARTSTNLAMVQVTIIMIRSMKMPVRLMMTGMIVMPFTNRIRSRRDGDLVGMMEVVLSTPDDHHGDHANALQSIWSLDSKDSCFLDVYENDDDDWDTWKYETTQRMQ